MPDPIMVVMTLSGTLKNGELNRAVDRLLPEGIPYQITMSGPKGGFQEFEITLEGVSIDEAQDILGTFSGVSDA